MADHHHHHQRPHRLSIPPRAGEVSTAASRPSFPLFPYSSLTPTPTPSKSRLYPKSSSKSSISFLFFLLFSLRSLYSLLPFLRSSPSFSLFPFSFLVSLLSLLLTLFFSLFTNSSSTSNFQFQISRQNRGIFSLSSISHSQLKTLVAKSILLAIVFLLRFQALLYCGTAAMILAELIGNVAARFMVEGRNQITMNDRFRSRSSEVRGFLSLFFGLFLLSISWDRIDCFPFATSFIDKYGFSVVPRENCMTIWPMLLPFLSGFLGYYERISMNWGTIRQLGQKRVRLISLFLTTVILFVPAVISMFMFEAEGKSVSFGNLAWPLANTVVFGVLLNENYSDDKLVSSKDFRTEFLVTFVCTVILELLYFPELSLWGLLFCGLLLYVAVRDLDPVYLNYLELGVEPSASITTMVMKPIHHILSERKSRKIALFLLINTGYMVVEFVAGFMSNSLGLISDACHMLFDCAALAIGLYASYISRLPANNRFNYGRGRFEILSGYANAVFLILVGALIVLESFERILDPQEISTTSLLTVSIGGLVVNIVGLIFFHEEHHHAHGGLGSCSHSHSHMNSHSCADSHRHDKHEHDSCRKHENQISVTEECRESSVTVHHEHSHVEVCSESHLSNHHDCHQDHNHTNHHDLDHVHHHEHSHHHHEHDQHSHLSQVETNMPKIVSHGVSESSHRQPAEMKVHQKKHHHHHIDHNMEGIFLHVLADTMGSVGVVISTLLIEYKGWVVADPACSIFISIMIIASVIPLLRNSAEILLQRVPRAHEQDLKEAVNEIMKIQGVQYVQNLHVWSFTNTDVVGTLQLHVSTETDKISTKAKVEQILHDAGINDLTLQLEYDPQVS
ncbi:zinc transporter 5-like [Cucurbita maxima]|uniref:Zinc transporter 5-like n=1 Tax=Cucurbita maxima TaxID=3661 RepID=A0A6J1HZF4_CUCMA|nr:zinc transporter 5-like [Cucurbita maxima]